MALVELNRAASADRMCKVRRLTWDHNAYYHGLLVRWLPPDCRRVLDVGCSAGAFAAELAARCEHVDALDRSPQMIELAEQAAPANVLTCRSRLRWIGCRRCSGRAVFSR